MGNEWKPPWSRWSETELVKWWLERAESYGNGESALNL